MSGTMNCPRCGRLFRKILSPVCPSCEKLEEEQFKNLRDYLEENPAATITQCSEETGVPTKRILRYIREGRLIVPEGMVDEVRCTQCGIQIPEGNFCDPCAAKMAKELAGALVGSPALEAAIKKAEPIPEKKKGQGFHTRNDS